MTNHPSCQQLCDLLESTCLLDTPLTPKDVRVSEKINGLVLTASLGNSQPLLSYRLSVPASIPGELFEGKKHRVPSLLVIDDFSGYVHCLRMEGKLSSMLIKKIREVVGIGVSSLTSIFWVPVRSMLRLGFMKRRLKT